MDGHDFTLAQILSLLDPIVGRTLGEVDTAGVFERARGHPKITGIAGMVVEQSVLGYPPDVRQECDITVDGEEVEVKTTGIRREGSSFAAKEPMSITAVSPDSIVSEDFWASHFWKKVARMLLVYYLYDSEEVVPAPGYAGFPVMGWELHRIPEEDARALMQDWLVVRRHVEQALSEGGPVRLPHSMRRELVLIDTAPKDRPRFRLKRSYVDSIVKDYFRSGGRGKLRFSRFSELDALCRAARERFGGMTVGWIAACLGMPEPTSKNAAEAVAVRMLGEDGGRINSIPALARAGVVGKTIALSQKGGRTEDMKLFPICFDEAGNDWEDTSFFSFFAEHQLLCAVFQERGPGLPLSENRFLGFKRLSFEEGFIESEAKRTWEEIARLVIAGEIREEPVLARDGTQRKNPAGTGMTRLNLPKSKDHAVFSRGSARDSTDKPLILNGVAMYRQWAWMRGRDVVGMLERQGFLRVPQQEAPQDARSPSASTSLRPILSTSCTTRALPMQKYLWRSVMPVSVHPSGNPFSLSHSTGVRMRSLPVQGSSTMWLERFTVPSEVSMVLPGRSSMSGNGMAPSE